MSTVYSRSGSPIFTNGKPRTRVVTGDEIPLPGGPELRGEYNTIFRLLNTNPKWKEAEGWRRAIKRESDAAPYGADLQPLADRYRQVEAEAHDMWEDVCNILGFDVRYTNKDHANEGEFNVGDPEYEQAYFCHKAKTLAEGKAYQEAREHARHEAGERIVNADSQPAGGARFGS